MLKWRFTDECDQMQEEKVVTRHCQLSNNRVFSAKYEIVIVESEK